MIWVSNFFLLTPHFPFFLRRKGHEFKIYNQQKLPDLPNDLFILFIFLGAFASWSATFPCKFFSSYVSIQNLSVNLECFKQFCSFKRAMECLFIPPYLTFSSGPKNKWKSLLHNNFYFTLALPVHSMFSLFFLFENPDGPACFSLRVAVFRCNWSNRSAKSLDPILFKSWLSSVRFSLESALRSFNVPVVTPKQY